MKNVFARTVLALVLIPSFWMTSVGTAAAGGWVDTPGETVGPLAKCHDKTESANGTSPASNCQPIQVSFTVLGHFFACLTANTALVNPPRGESRLRQFVGKPGESQWGPSLIRYMQFVPEYEGALAGLCYYYEAGSSSGAGGDYTWRWDE